MVESISTLESSYKITCRECTSLKNKTGILTISKEK